MTNLIVALDKATSPVRRVSRRQEGARQALEREARLSSYLKQRDYHAAMALLKQSDHLFERTVHLMEHSLLMSPVTKVRKERGSSYPPLCQVRLLRILDECLMYI